MLHSIKCYCKWLKSMVCHLVINCNRCKKGKKIILHFVSGCVNPHHSLGCFILYLIRVFSNDWLCRQKKKASKYFWWNFFLLKRFALNYILLEHKSFKTPTRFCFWELPQSSSQQSVLKEEVRTWGHCVGWTLLNFSINSRPSLTGWLISSNQTSLFNFPLWMRTKTFPFLFSYCLLPAGTWYMIFALLVMTLNFPVILFIQTQRCLCMSVSSSTVGLH